MSEWSPLRGDPVYLGRTKGMDRWKVRLYAGKDTSGRQRQRSVTFLLKPNKDGSPAINEARKRASRERDTLRDTLRAAVLEAGTVGRLCDEWQAVKKRSHSITTQYADGVRLNHIRARLGHIRLELLTARELDRFYGELLDQGKSASTVLHYHRNLHAMLRQAHKWQAVPGNVADLASPPSIVGNAAPHRLPTPAALRVLIDACPPSLRVAATVAAATGARRGEIVGLLWSDLQGTQLTIARALVQVPGRPMEVRAPKSGKVRALTLDPVTIAVLGAHRVWLEEHAGELAPDGPIFAKLVDDPTGRTPYPPDWITHEWRRLCKRHKVEFRFHDLRHFHATQLIGARIPISTVSQRLGHSKISTTTDIYTHALKAGDEDAARAIQQVMAP